MQSTYTTIVALTDGFCKEHLNEEYAQLARQLTAALCRKRPSPLSRGKPNSWACGIIYALGFVNFLFDKSHEPYLSATELCTGFGISKSTGSNKSRQIRDLMDMVQFDPSWCLPSLMDENPLAWMIMVDGLIVDARRAPLSIQQAAYEKGIIPYIPGQTGGERLNRGKMVSKRIENLLRKALIQNEEMAEALYEYELVEHIDYWYKGLKRDQNEYVFAITENSGDTAMVLITKEKKIYVNEAARDKLFELWGRAYQSNVERLIPEMAEQLANDIIAVNGVSVMRN